MREAPAAVWNCIEPVVEGLGYRFVGAQFGRHDSNGLLRVFIDAAEPGAGIGVEDCARVSRQLSAVLDVEDPIAGHYVLEVSSPGLDRPLFRAADYAAFRGSLIRVKLLQPRDGRRNFKGRLLEAGEDRFVVRGEDQDWELAIAEVDEARLVPEL